MWGSGKSTFELNFRCNAVNVKSGQHGKSRKLLFYEEMLASLESQRQAVKTKTMFSLNS